MPKESCHRLGVLVLNNASPFEIGVATEIFGLHRPEIESYNYRLDTCGPPSVRMRQGFFTMKPSAPLHALADMHTVIVPGHPEHGQPIDPRTIEVLQRAATNGARLVSYCSGSLVLAEAGLLDGKRATTHWRYTDELATRFPSVLVQPDVLFVQDGKVFTAAGSAAALDLSLHIVRIDHGEAAAASVARRLVFAGHRHGDQRQFVDPPTAREPVASLASLHDYATENLDSELTVAELATQAAMSVSSFHRWFKQQHQSTPHQWLIGLRVARARALLESSDHTVEEITRLCGMGTSTNLRQHFRRIVGTTPTSYRTSFQQAAAET